MIGRPVAEAPGGGVGTLAAARSAAPARDSLVARLAAFAALAAFGAAHWAMLVVEAPAGRTLLVVLTATAGGAALALLGTLSNRLPRAALWSAASVIALATLALGLMAAGLEGRLLLPGHWDELGDGLDRGLSGIESVDWPYDGLDEWIRQTILLGGPFLLGIAAALSFWPALRAGSVLRALGLVVLLVFYGVAVTENDPGAPLLRGLVLLVLVGAWLWLPRLPPREGGLAAAVVAGVGVLSLPLAAALDGDRPWWDYHAWNLFGSGKAVTFDWTHEYGPLDWPREGTTLLNVKAERPQYWKAETLDTFDGLRWIRTLQGQNEGIGSELPFKSQDPDGPWDYFEYNPKWDERITFTVRALSTDIVVGAGLTYRVEPITAQPSSDGTTRLIGDRLERGDSYTVSAYAPDPSADQMRGAPAGYPGWLTKYTSLYLPARGDSATEGVGLQGDAGRQGALEGRRTLYVPLRGDRDSGSGPAALEALEGSRYQQAYALARRLTADEPTAYDAVKRVEAYLQRNYSYTERVPTRPLPLNGFLFQERRGYCQHFSGAMALMLRMSGIPARVSGGFSPGSFNKDTGEFRVRDLDAHSWVEVWFTGIGWVPFDPTPAAAPAESQSSALAASAAAADAGEVRRSREGVAASERGTDTGAALADEGGSSPFLIGLLVIALGSAGAAVAYPAVRMKRLRSAAPGELADAQLAELLRGLKLLGWELPASTTLLRLERRLGRLAGPASEAYAGGLRAHRYDPRAPDAPSLRRRREVRRELSRGSVRDRLRGLLAFPPVGPRV